MTHPNSLPPQPESPNDLSRPTTTNLAEAYHVLRKYWATAFAVLLVVGLATTFYTLGLTKIYRASAIIQFDPSPPKPLGKDVEAVVDMGVGNFWNNQEYYQTQFKIIQSMRLATRVVTELNLQNDAGFIRNLPPGDKGPPVQLTPEMTAEILLGRLGVEPIRDSRLAIIRYDDADPQRARRIVEAVVERYIEQNLDDALDSTNAASEWLRAQLDKLKTDLESNEMALHEFKLAKNILSVAFDDQSNMLRDEMKHINDSLTSVRIRLQEVAARYGELSKVSPDEPSNLPVGELLGSSHLTSLRQNYENALRERDSYLVLGKGAHHPDVEAAQTRVDGAKAALAAEVRNIQGALERELSVVRQQESGLSSVFERAKKQALDLNLLEIEYNRLRRSKENTEKLYQLVLERTKESDLTRMLRVNNLRVLDHPQLPRTPVRPQILTNIGVGIALGLVLGLAAAMARALMDRTLRTPQDIEVELGIPFLGLLPEIEQGRDGSLFLRQGRRKRPHRKVGTRELIVHEHPSSGVAEASRSIRTNLMFMSPDRPYRTVLVTSAGPTEGKTTVACCIAIAMAQAGQRVVLLDCDLRRPRLHRVFGKGSDKGVTTSLLEGDLEAAAFPTDVPNLSVIPAGPLPPNPAELVQSEKFRVALQKLSERFDRVIIDSPPVVPVTDAAVLSMLVDGTVLVVKGLSTKKEMGRQAMRALADLGAKPAGAVLNAINLTRYDYRNHYYYYHKDGYYAAERQPREEPEELPSTPSSDARPN